MNDHLPASDATTSGGGPMIRFDFTGKVAIVTGSGGGQRLRVGPTDAAARSGDDGHLAGEVEADHRAPTGRRRIACREGGVHDCSVRWRRAVTFSATSFTPVESGQPM